MSTKIPMAVQLDPKAPQLVQRLAQKTVEGKLRWNRQSNIFSAAIKDGAITCLFQSAEIPTGTMWTRFIVRSAEGPIVDITNSPLTALLSAASPVHAAVGQLFSVVARSNESGVDRALKLIDQL